MWHIKSKPEIDESMEREPANLNDFKAVLRQMMLATAESRPQSENREPTKVELKQKWVLRGHPK